MRKFLLTCGILFTSFTGGVLAQSFGGAVVKAIALPLGFVFNVTVGSRPTPLGTWTSLATAFTGNDTNIVNATAYTINGAATLGQPSSGYLYTEEAYPNAAFMVNNSGWNQSTSNNSGRTAAVYSRVHMINSGQGDAMIYNGTCTVTSSLPGATSYLANPACGLFAGDVFNGGGVGAFLNPFEIHLNDEGVESAGAGAVFNLTRAVSTASLGELWQGIVIQSQGAAAVDYAYRATGPFTNGVDMSGGTFTNSAPFLGPLTTPANSSVTCKAGGIEWDASFIYVCTATNTWKRVSLTAF